VKNRILHPRFPHVLDTMVGDWLDSLGLVQPPQRTVGCLHCAAPFVVPGQAEVLTCPRCSRRVRVDDILVTGRQRDGRVETCGSIVVRRGGCYRIDGLKAGMGVLVEGEVLAGAAAAPIVVIADGAVWTGDLQTAKLELHPNATIKGGRFSVRADRLSA
jgi:hypothetical protein